MAKKKKEKSFSSFVNNPIDFTLLITILLLLSMGLGPKGKFSAILDMIFEWSLAYWIFVGICFLAINSFNK